MGLNHSDYIIKKCLVTNAQTQSNINQVEWHIRRSFRRAIQFFSLASNQIDNGRVRLFRFSISGLIWDDETNRETFR